MSRRFILPWMQGPPVLRRFGRNYLVASCVAVLLAIALGVFAKPLGVPRKPWRLVGPLVLGSLPLCVFTPIAWWMGRRVRQQFNEADGRLCTHCAYIIGPLGDKGICPECGERFDAEADAVTWASFGYKRGR